MAGFGWPLTANGGRVVLTPLVKGLSTSGIIKKILAVFGEECTVLSVFPVRREFLGLPNLELMRNLSGSDGGRP